MKRFSICTALLFLFVMFAGSIQTTALPLEGCGVGHAECAPGCHPEGEKCGPGCDLDLTDEQTEKLHHLKLEHEKKMIDLRAGLKKLEIGMKEEMMKESPDKNSMMKHVDKIMEIRGKMKRAGIEMLFEARTIVPAEKWKTLVRCHMMHKRGTGDIRVGRKMMRKSRGCGDHGEMRGESRGHCGMGSKAKCGG